MHDINFHYSHNYISRSRLVRGGGAGLLGALLSRGARTCWGQHSGTVLVRGDPPRPFGQRSPREHRPSRRANGASDRVGSSVAEWFSVLKKAVRQTVPRSRRQGHRRQARSVDDRQRRPEGREDDAGSPARAHLVAAKKRLRCWPIATSSPWMFAFANPRSRSRRRRCHSPTSP